MVSGTARAPHVQVVPPGQVEAEHTTSLHLTLFNGSPLDWHGSVAVRSGGRSVGTHTGWVDGQASQTILMTWTPQFAAVVPLTVTEGSRMVWKGRVTIAAVPRPGVGRLLMLSSPLNWSLPLSAGLTLLLAVFVFAVWRRAYGAV